MPCIQDPYISQEAERMKRRRWTIIHYRPSDRPTDTLSMEPRDTAGRFGGTKSPNKSMSLQPIRRSIGQEASRSPITSINGLTSQLGLKHRLRKRRIGKSRRERSIDIG